MLVFGILRNGEKGWEAGKWGCRKLGCVDGWAPPCLRMQKEGFCWQLMFPSLEKLFLVAST